MTLVPALFTLLRERTWYIPRWLDRLLPNVTIEPPHDREAPGAPHAKPAEAPAKA
jgi:RND superfamily putative drug exporter